MYLAISYKSLGDITAVELIVYWVAAMPVWMAEPQMKATALASSETCCQPKLVMKKAGKSAN